MSCCDTHDSEYQYDCLSDYEDTFYCSNCKTFDDSCISCCWIIMLQEFYDYEDWLEGYRAEYEFDVEKPERVHPHYSLKFSSKSQKISSDKRTQKQFHQKKNLNGSKTSRSPKNRSSPKKNRFLMNDFKLE